MPLPVLDNREHIHTRTIVMTAFRRDDGLLDVEGHLTDVKPFAHQMMDSFRAAGEPVHDLSLRISLDDTSSRRTRIHSAKSARTLLKSVWRGRLHATVQEWTDMRCAITSANKFSA